MSIHSKPTIKLEKDIGDFAADTSNGRQSAAVLLCAARVQRGWSAASSDSAALAPLTKSRPRL